MKIIYFLWLYTVILASCHSAGAGRSDETETELPEYRRISGKTYYVASTGYDGSDGLSPATPWRTIEKLNSSLYDFQPGDTILFKRGDLFRGNLNPAAGNRNNWIRYGAYGSGAKPMITGSLSMSSPEDWTHYSGNIWRSTNSLDRDIGSLYMNGDDSEVGERRWSIEDLWENGDFFKDPSGDDKHLYVFSDGGSPADLYNQIEAAVNEHIINLDSRSYILFENLHLSRGGGHGFGGSNTAYIIIRNSEFSYLGGGFLHYNGSEPVRYGNGIELWGNAENNLIDGNLFYEIYDTAVTNQNHSRSAVQRNLYYMNNIIINCGLASFELWNRPSSSIMENIYFIHNTSINPGYGWGGALHRKDRKSFHIASYYNESKGHNLVIQNNIFYTSITPPGAEHHLFFFDEDVMGGMGKYKIDNNIWYMPDPLWAITTSTQYSAFSDWKEATGQSLNGLNKDPLFIDTDSGNYQLQKASPAVDRGLETLRQSDYLGRKNRGIPDMGALEFQ